MPVHYLKCKLSNNIIRFVEINEIFFLIINFRIDKRMKKILTKCIQDASNYC